MWSFEADDFGLQPTSLFSRCRPVQPDGARGGKGHQACLRLSAPPIGLDAVLVGAIKDQQALIDAKDLAAAQLGGHQAGPVVGGAGPQPGAAAACSDGAMWRPLAAAMAAPGTVASGRRDFAGLALARKLQ
ncbi:MAG: hypothetical protein HY744_10660 [Deltaproteobacteria bacterium]|nr:hypothetical protein [Deltaproteobacteria bacterium]